LKNQNDLIVMIAATVISLGVGLGFFFSKHVPEKPAPPTPVPTEAAKPQEGAVVMANSLPGGGTSTGGGGAAGAGGLQRKKGGAGGF
jgi:hypothetical protein